MGKEDQARPSVIVIGAGPTGLALAIELGTRSIPCLVLERNERAGHAPRAKTTHVRTREIMRRWGIADALAAVSPLGIDYPTDIHFVTRLGGQAITKFPKALNCSPARDERYSEHGQWVPQYKLEEVLRTKAESLPSVTLRYGVEFVGFEQLEGKVRVCYESIANGDSGQVECDYLVGADGPRSAVRKAMGATMVGVSGLSRNYNIIFRAPGLAQAHPHGPGVMYWQMNADSPSVIGRIDSGDLWFFGPTDLPADMTLSEEEAVSLIKRSTGIDLPYEILSSDVWIVNRLLADRYREGRVFLAGDACHLHPPFGGFGMNMGIADALDLGWKLAAVLQGWGGSPLLDSYEIERRSIHDLVLDETENNHAILPNQLFREGIEDQTPEGEAIREEVAKLIWQTKHREFHSLGIVLGLRYLDSPFILQDGSQHDWSVSIDYEPSGAPGCLAPHKWIDDDRSLYDLFGPGFTLLVFSDDGRSDVAVARREADNAEIPLEIVTLADPDLAKLYGASRALVRPDQTVAWRGNVWPENNVLHHVTGRSAVTHPACSESAD